MEVWTKTPSSRGLSGRRSKDTAPELHLRRALHAAGGRFRLHRRLGPGCTPDLVLPRRRVAVFVDGDFWHGCPKHFGHRAVGGPNATLWATKFVAVRERDLRATHLAEAAGWLVVRVWECEVWADATAVAARILNAPRTASERRDDTPSALGPVRPCG